MKKTLKILRGLSAFGLMLSSAACSVDATNPAQGQAEEGTTTFSISDATGTSTAKVTIHSDNPADLALTADDFELVAITGEKLGAEGDAATQPDAGAPATDDASDDDSAGGTDIDLSDEVLADGVVAVELVERDSPDYRAPFVDRYYYSLVNRVRTASVTRHATFNKVYVSMYYNLAANAPWSTLVSDYKLSNKETKTREAPTNTYQMRIKVRGRNTNDYTTEFVE